MREHIRVNQEKASRVKTGTSKWSTLKIADTRKFPEGRGNYDLDQEIPQDEELIIGKNIIFDDLAKRSRVLLINDPKTKKLFLDNGIIGEPIGEGRRKDRQYHLHPSPLSISAFDFLFAYDLNLLTPNYDQSWTELRKEIVEWGESHHDNFTGKYASYMVLRNQGLIVMDALRYGVDFEVYQESPTEFLEKGEIDHGPAIVQVISNIDDLTVKEAIKGELISKQIHKRYYIFHPKVTTDEYGEITGNIDVYAVDTSGLKLNYGDYSVESMIIRDLVNSGTVNVVPIELEWMIQDNRGRSR